jgi:hypothetical protein
MHGRVSIFFIATVSAAILTATPAPAGQFTFSTGDPEGKIATLSRPASPGKIETETADDFLLTQPKRIDSASFTGLLPSGAALSSITQVEIELYHVFPNDSANPPSGNVPTRTNSPADVEIASATRDSLAGTLSFSATLLNSNFAAANSVVNGINKITNQFTGGEGAVTGEQVRLDVTFNPGILLPADHYFIRPEVGLASGDFLWLSAPKPIVSPGLPSPPTCKPGSAIPTWRRTGCGSGRISTRKVRSMPRSPSRVNPSPNHPLCCS